MNDDLMEIGRRLAGLRESLDMTQEDFAKSCNIPIETYKLYEKGEQDITISVMKDIANKYNIDVSVLMFDEEPKMSSYFLTRKGKGLSVRRLDKHKYEYQTLAGGFNNRKADVFEVTVAPNDVDVTDYISSHDNQEFTMVLEGKLLLHINGKDLIMEEGDSIYFDSNLPHAMKALGDKKVIFLAVIL